MSEQFEKRKQDLYAFPDIEHERGEIERVAREFEPDDTESFTARFIESARNSHLAPFTENLWQRLENTNSLEIALGDWEKVEHHATKADPDHPRDWADLKDKALRGKVVDAPMILDINGRLHKVSGDTRLMVARAAGITPKVLIVKMG